MAISGHVTLAMAQKYCETFNCRDMADSATSRLIDTNAKKNLTNYPEKFIKNVANILKIKD